MTKISAKPRLHSTTQTLSDVRSVKITPPSAHSVDQLKLNNEKEHTGCLKLWLKWACDLFLSLFCCFRGEKNTKDETECLETRTHQPSTTDLQVPLLPNKEVLEGQSAKEVSEQQESILSELPPSLPQKKLEEIQPVDEDDLPPLEETPLEMEFSPNPEHHAFALQFMHDFYSVVALLNSKTALERFEKAHPRAQDWVLYYLAKNCCFSALFYYTTHLIKEEGRRETLYDIAQVSNLGGKDRFVDPHNVTEGQRLWMMEIFKQGIPAWSTYIFDKNPWLVMK